MKNLVRANELT